MAGARGAGVPLVKSVVYDMMRDGVNFLDDAQCFILDLTQARKWTMTI